MAKNNIRTINIDLITFGDFLVCLASDNLDLLLVLGEVVIIKKDNPSRLSTPAQGCTLAFFERLPIFGYNQSNELAFTNLY